MKQYTQKQNGDAVHGERLDGPVDKKGQKDRLAAFAGLDHLAEIDFDHDGIHHEKQTDGNRDRDHRRFIHINGHTVQGSC